MVMSESDFCLWKQCSEEGWLKQMNRQDKQAVFSHSFQNPTKKLLMFSLSSGRSQPPSSR